MKHLINIGIIFSVVILVFNAFSADAQKVLSEQETNWVLEAKAELEMALSDPGIDESNRQAMIERSAKTLKEYGQPWAYPQGDIPLQELMDSNFDQCKERIVEFSDLALQTQTNTLDKQLEIINQLQIEVGERQLQMLIPRGNAAVSLSMELVNTVFDVNLVEGLSGGQRGNAQNLKERFMELARQKKLGKCFNQIVDDDKRSLILINNDRNKLKVMENKWESIFRRATASTQTINGYEGAILVTDAQPQSQSQPQSQPEKTTSFKANILVGTWKFGFKETGYFYLVFKNDGTFTFEDKMNDGNDILTGKYSVSGNILKLIGPKNQCENVEGTYPFVVEPEELVFKNIKDPCISRKFTLDHMWEK